MDYVTINAPIVEIYAGLSTTSRPDDNKELSRVTAVTFTTVFPFGIYGTASFFIPRKDATRRWSWKPGDRTVIRNGTKLVWEGKLNGATWAVHENETGLLMVCSGQWGDNLGRQTLNKRWADNRVEEWRPPPEDVFTAFDLYQRDDALTAVTKEMVYRTGDIVPIGRYTNPTGETSKRITFDYALFNEGRWVPDAAKHNNAPAGANTFTDLDNALDDDDSTYAAVTLTSDDYLYICTTEERWEEFFLYVNMGAVVNSVLSTLSCEYSQGGGTWATQTITDGTSSGGATFAQDGYITISADRAGTEWTFDRVDGRTGRWLRFKANANLTANIRFIQLEFVQNQSFKLALLNSGTAADEWSVTSTGSGSADVTFGTPDTAPAFTFRSQGNQRGFGNGSVYGQISNIVVYSETGSITVNAIVTDIHGYGLYLNSDTAYIAANALAVVPFITQGYESLASLLERITAYGDSSQNSWHAKLLDSEWALTPDGKPVLALEQYPALTDHDYVVNIGESNIVGDIDVVLDSSNQANYVIVAYRDKETGLQKYLTPDDNSALMDTTSITVYGERHVVIDAGEATSTTALAFGQRYLKEYKNPKWYVASPITIAGHIRAANKQPVPAANIQAGKRLRIENFLHDLYDSTDVTGLVELIAETSYNDSDQTCRMSLGNIQDDAAILLARAIAATTPATIGGPLGLPRFGR